MNTYDFVHLAFQAMGGEIKGRTKLQKVVYFLGVIAGNVEDLGYKPHFYGPYSAEVANAVDQLKSLGFVDQSVSSAGGHDSAGFEVARYDYRLNEQGRSVAQSKSRVHSVEWSKMTHAAKVLQAAGLTKYDYMKLSIAAKIYFMIGQKGGKQTVDDLAKLATNFGWTVTSEQASQAAQFLRDLKLVTVTKPAN